MCELEQKSWDISEDHTAVVSAKYYIMKEMTQKGKHTIAEEYLKKCLLQFSGHADIVEGLLLMYSKVVKKYYASLKGVDFVLDMVKKAAVQNIGDHLFRNLLVFI